MGYPSLSNVMTSVQRLNLDNGRIVRTKGLWHVLIFLRHRQLNEGHKEQLFKSSFDLTEACFDLTGITLPIKLKDRDVYYEPGATQGVPPREFFRHVEGPRQTFLNRIYTGLTGNGPNQPRLFTASKNNLPTLVSLVPDWIAELRKYEWNRFVLDERSIDLFTWIFRFGLPYNNQFNRSISLARHSQGGEVEPREDIVRQPLPNTFSELSNKLIDYFGLTQSEIDTLFYSSSANLFPPDFSGLWPASEPITFSVLGQEMRKVFGPESATEVSDVPSPELVTTTDQIDKTTEFENPDKTGIDWQTLTDSLMNNPPLIGVTNAIARCIAALRAGKFVILLGPPGTGKTVLATHICTLAENNGARGYIVGTATAEWTTFETLGGYVPKKDNPSELEFKRRLITESLFTNQWLVIDELNRADIDKAFGELFTLFSGQKVRLPYQDDNDYPIVLVPPAKEAGSKESPIKQGEDWRMIGTMNTFDKASLFQLSYAFMRRFAFVELPIPNRINYEHLLEGDVANLAGEERGVNFREVVLDYLKKIFCPVKGGLPALGLGVGPAIPKDIIRFIAIRYLEERTNNIANAAKDIILEGLQMYLYPQFEGHDAEHEKIVQIVADVFEATGQERDEISRELGIWTGFVGDSVSNDL